MARIANCSAVRAYQLGHRGSIPSAKNKPCSPMYNIQLKTFAHITENCLSPRTKKVLNPGFKPSIFQINIETSTLKKIPKSGDNKCISFPFPENMPEATTLEQRNVDRRKISNVY